MSKKREIEGLEGRQPPDPAGEKDRQVEVILSSEQAARDVLRQQQLLQNIYDTVPCGIIRLSRENGKYSLLSINRASQELLGYEDRSSGLSDWKNGIVGRVLEEDRSELRKANDVLIKPGDQVEVSYRIRRTDGGIRWVSGTNSMVSSRGGRDIIQRTIFDVTDRHLLQEQLEQEREMYRLAMESSSDVMYEYRMDEDTFISYEPKADGGVYKIALPHYQETLRTKKIVHPDYIQAALDNICGACTETIEILMRSPKCRDYQWYRITGKLLSSKGQPRRVVGTLCNIQEEKSALMSNQEVLHMHQSAIQAMSNIYLSIYYIDLPANHYYGIRIPEAFQSVIPRSGNFQQTMSLYFSSFAAAEELPRLLPYASCDYLSKHMHSVGQHMEVEFMRQNDGKEPSWLRLELQLVSTENGRPKNVVAAFRNITESRRMELKRRQEEEQATRAMEDAYAAAQSANQAKSDFLSKMSHDMRTPMNAIMGMTTIARENMDDPDRLRDCLEKIHLSSHHLLNLINEVLDMSKIESGSISLNESVVNLREVLRETAEIIRPDVERKHHCFRIVDASLEHGFVLGDAVRISQILLNLLSNSVKYTPDGGSITLSLDESEYYSSTTRRYTFTVEDNGIGMSDDFQKKLFQPFTRAEDSRVSRIQGTGLGMSITQNLVQMMNGSIHVSSRLDHGTCISVALVLRTAQTSPDSRPLDEPAPDLHGGYRILLVEDNALNREIARYMLEDAGLTVDEAEDGQEAIQTFQNSFPHYYDLILMDIQMPVMDGYLSTRAIRALDRPDAASVPIVALTANAFAEDVDRARQAGMNDHIAKPLDAPTLLRTLARWLKRPCPENP